MDSIVSPTPQTEALPQELFSVTFKLRKKHIVFPGLLNQVSYLQENGFHLLFSTGTGNDERWLNIDCYEKTQQHPTLTLRRMLATAPDKREKLILSAINFATMHNSKMSFSISDELPEFTVTAHQPVREFDKNQIVNNCRLLEIPLLTK